LNGDINEVLTCDTLMMAGHSQGLLGMMYKLQVPFLGLLGVTILVITGYVRDKFMDPDEYWEMHNVAGSVIYDESSDLDWEDMLPLHFVDGLYPLFPNAAYPILGLAIGKLIHGQQAAKKIQLFEQDLTSWWNYHCMRCYAYIGW